jgi:hypothetical protein
MEFLVSRVPPRKVVNYPKLHDVNIFPHLSHVCNLYPYKPSCYGIYGQDLVSLTRGSWALLPPATETLRPDIRVVTYCPEDGKLAFGGWVVVKE